MNFIFFIIYMLLIADVVAQNDGIQQDFSNEEQSTNLEFLPPEMYQEIGKHLSKEDLKNFTQTNKFMQYSKIFGGMNYGIDFIEFDIQTNKDYEKLKNYLNFAHQQNIFVGVKLKISRFLSPISFAKLLNDPNLHWDRVTYLSLKNNSITDEKIEVLTTSNQFSQLQYLDLSENEIHNGGIETLSQASNLSQLQYLDLGSNYIDYMGVFELVKSSHLSKLQYLNLASNSIGPEGASLLANSGQLSQLEHLDLSSNGLGAEGVQALSQSPHLSQVEHLDLGSNDIGLEGLKHLLNSPNISKLNWLGLKYNQLGSQGANSIASSANLSKLKYLDLAGNGLKYDDIKFISKYLKSLEEIKVGKRFNDDTDFYSYIIYMPNRKIRITA